MEFARLGLVIVDEQHRFGVLQRKRLMEKGDGAGRAGDDGHADSAHAFAHALRRPRHFGDRPDAAGPRADRNALVRREAHLPGVWDFLRREIAAGRQAYVVYPVIEQSKSAEAQRSLKAAIVEFERLRRRVFPNRTSACCMAA